MIIRSFDEFVALIIPPPQLVAIRRRQFVAQKEFIASMNSSLDKNKFLHQRRAIISCLACLLRRDLSIFLLLYLTLEFCASERRLNNTRGIYTCLGVILLNLPAFLIIIIQTTIIRECILTPQSKYWQTNF